MAYKEGRKYAYQEFLVDEDSGDKKELAVIINEEASKTEGLEQRVTTLETDVLAIQQELSNMAAPTELPAQNGLSIAAAYGTTGNAYEWGGSPLLHSTQIDCVSHTVTFDNFGDFVLNGDAANMTVENVFNITGNQAINLTGVDEIVCSTDFMDIQAATLLNLGAGATTVVLKSQHLGINNANAVLNNGSLPSGTVYSLASDGILRVKP